MMADGRNLAVRCSCGHRSVLSGKALSRWWFVKRWDGRKHLIAGHLRCSKCGARPERMAITYATPDAVWKGPASEGEWKRLMARMRG